MEQYEFYILVVINTPKEENALCFATEAEINGVLPVDTDLNKAYVTKDYYDNDKELIYLKKSAVDALAIGVEGGRKIVPNNKENRKELGLKYKKGFLKKRKVKEPKEAATKKPRFAEWLEVLKMGLNLLLTMKEESKAKKPSSSAAPSINLTVLAQKIHALNQAKGFWDKHRSVGELLMGVTAELSGAMEAYQESTPANWDLYDAGIYSPKEAFEHYIQHTFEDKIAGAIIRLLDLAAGMNIDIERHVRVKLAYHYLKENKD
ncbi:nucleoside triphosphate pyrophosphohydrolase family protein [Aureispira anguillae]|uniref:Uncharacterized protein n=1 Tax=Aureispira anguillae TaxID=2864201 RepID=A0A916DQ40_9BACT|nr:hypothetical protein [Aureispira anguillae]BDS10944.1 hypothetical protein AsAng_0016540 [Aureispira anguillae]